jgi:hypothetical protein
MKYNTLILTAFLLLFALSLTPITADSEDKADSNSGVIMEDVVIGNDTDETIDTGDGNDNIDGRGGNDTIDAGKGDDLVEGGAGNDKIKGGEGDDLIIGGAGKDTVTDGPGNDYVNLGPGDDTFVYYVDENVGSVDFAAGGDGDDTLILVSDDINEALGNDIVKYYEKEKMVGTDITHLGNFDIAMGVTGFENVVVTAGFSF